MRTNIFTNHNSEELVAKYLANGGAVTQCKDYNPGSRNRPKRAKNKHFVTDEERQRGRRRGSII